MKNVLFFIAFTFSFFILSVEAQTNINGVINEYTVVSAVNTSTGSVTVNSSSAFTVGDEVLLIQSKGASINSSQSSSFGSISNYNNAGNYEVMKICAIQGNSITFTKPLQETYSTGGQIQLVTVPVYNGALIFGADLTAQKWDGATGGILIFRVNGLLDFGIQDIDVSRTGFQGGRAVTSGNGCTFIDDVTYYSDSTSANAKALKGEGIAAYISQRECGRGPQANGGGGGNNHNAGGGGGANYGAGGAGGQRVKATSFTCGSVVGISSKALANAYTGNKIFLGGGGGAGHGNNIGLVGESGENGGGIAIVLADTIKGNGQRIIANGGSNASNSVEGGGGGGAGGTVFLMSDHFVDSLNVEVNGGNGTSTANVGTSNCNGPGGGGGGGVVLLSASSQPAILLINSAGGSAGVIASTSQSNCTVGSNNGAGDGQSGTVLFNQVLNDQSAGLPIESITDTACFEYMSPSGKYVWTSSGQYQDTVSNTNGCQKIVQVDLVIDTVDVRVNNNLTSLEAVAFPATYQWIDCMNNFAIVSGAMNRVFTPTMNGSYAVIVTSGKCADTSECYDVQAVGLAEMSQLVDLSIFPNPCDGSMNLDFGRALEEVEVSLMGTDGRIIQIWTFRQSQRERLSLDSEPGIYFLKINGDDETVTKRVLIR